VASALAVDRALGWYLAEVPNANRPPVSADEARALRAALAGDRPWERAQVEVLVTFSHAIYRLARMSEEVPDCNLGDALTALARIATAREGTPRWSFDAAVDAGSFAKLEFAETSAGIVRVQRENREGWWAHGQRNRSFIEEAAGETGGHALAVVLGAAQAFDLPLAELARRFDRLLLVDIDAASMEATVATAIKDAGLRAKVETAVVDLTGINAAFVRAVDEVFAGPGGAAEIHDRLEDLARSYRLTSPPQLLPAGMPRADLVVSSCVLSQLGWPQRIYAQRLYEKRFGTIPTGEADRRWVTPWRELELRLQQDHINALAGAGATAVLTSDMVSQPMVLDAAGTDRPSGAKIFPMGVESMRERIPCSFQIHRQAAWTWYRFRPLRGGKPGSRMDVEGAVLREARSSAGLWLP
jgi:hypothetical protein